MCNDKYPITITNRRYLAILSNKGGVFITGSFFSSFFSLPLKCKAVTKLFHLFSVLSSSSSSNSVSVSSVSESDEFVSVFVLNIFSSY